MARTKEAARKAFQAREEKAREAGKGKVNYSTSLPKMPVKKKTAKKKTAKKRRPKLTLNRNLGDYKEALIEWKNQQATSAKKASAKKAKNASAKKAKKTSAKKAKNASAKKAKASAKKAKASALASAKKDDSPYTLGENREKKVVPYRSVRDVQIQKIMKMRRALEKVGADRPWVPKTKKDLSSLSDIDVSTMYYNLLEGAAHDLNYDEDILRTFEDQELGLYCWNRKCARET